MATLLKQHTNDYVKQQPIFQTLSQNANHVDIKSATGDVSMNQFIAGVFNYQPEWVTFLYRVRWAFVRLLGMKQEGIPRPLHLKPDNLDLTIGRKIGFFTIDAVEPDHYLFVSAEESHLKATLGLIRQPLDNPTSRYFAVTIVHYNSWAGPIYFNIIRPFHHIVVKQMLNAGIQA